MGQQETNGIQLSVIDHNIYQFIEYSKSLQKINTINLDVQDKLLNNEPIDLQSIRQLVMDLILSLSKKYKYNYKMRDHLENEIKKVGIIKSELTKVFRSQLFYLECMFKLSKGNQQLIWASLSQEDQLQLKLKELNDELQNVKDQKQECIQELKDLYDTNSNLEEKYKEFKKVNSANEDHLIKNRQKTVQLQLQLEETLVSKEKLKQQIQDLEIQIQQKDSQIFQNQIVIQQIQNNNSNLQQQIQELGMDLKEQRLLHENQQEDRINKQIESQKNKFTLIQQKQELDEMKDKIRLLNDLESKIESQENQINELKQKKKVGDNQFRYQIQMIYEQKQKISELSSMLSQIDSLRNQNNSLSSQLTSLININQKQQQRIQHLEKSN